MYPRRAQSIMPVRTVDAIVVVPGIMGSALKDSSDRLVWGFSRPEPYIRMLRPGGPGMTPLALTPAELADIHEGRYNPTAARLKPAGLLSFSSFAPLTGGFEPYTKLVAQLKRIVHPDAVLEFDYDWRLPTLLNSRLLATEMRDHLRRWRAHPEHERARALHPERRRAKIVIIAHSMGGLVARGLATTTDGFEDVRSVVTLGTPFYGSVQAAVILDSGEGTPVPLPRRRLREVARTMPGVYDLLPRNRCVLTHRDGIDDVVALAAADAARFGADRDLSEAAEVDFYSTRGTALPGHRAVAGVAQSTWQSLSVEGGTVEPANGSYRWDSDGQLIRDVVSRPIPFDDRGDGTVWRYSARPIGEGDAIPVAQQHGALATSGETIKQVAAIVTDQGDLGVKLGEGELGLDIPDIAIVDEPFAVAVTGDTDPGFVACKIVDLGTGDLIREPHLRISNHGLIASVKLQREGLYRVGVKAGAADWVTQVMLVTDKGS